MTLDAINEDETGPVGPNYNDQMRPSVPPSSPSNQATIFATAVGMPSDSEAGGAPTSGQVNKEPPHPMDESTNIVMRCSRHMFWAVVCLAVVVLFGATAGAVCATGHCTAERSNKSETVDRVVSTVSTLAPVVPSAPGDIQPLPTTPFMPPLVTPTLRPSPPPTLRPSSVLTLRPLPTPSCEVVASYFDSDAEGWILFRGGERLQHNIDGSIQARNTFGSNTVWYYKAPTKFNGDHSGASALSFSLRKDGHLVSVQDRDAIIRSSNVHLAQCTNEPWREFQTVSSTLFGPDKAGWQSGRTQTNATEEEIMIVLMDVGSLEIRGHFDSYIGVGSSLDNVVFECPDL